MKNNFFTTRYPKEMRLKKDRKENVTSDEQAKWHLSSM